MVKGSTSFDITVSATPDAYRYAVTTDYRGASESTEIEWNVESDFIDLRVMRSLGTTRNTRREYAGSADEVAAKELGQTLFEKLLPDRLGTQYLDAFREAVQVGDRLRLRLNLDRAPALSNVPWEYLHQARGGLKFLASSGRSQIVRHVGVAHRLPLTEINPPLRIGVVISGPSDASALALQPEWEHLSSALQDLVESGLVAIERLPSRWSEFTDRLRRRGDMPHVLHYMGHGDFDVRTQTGILLFESDDGTRHDVTAEKLATVLEDQPPTLVFLNSCRGAKTSATDPFAGMAQSLLGRGVEAIVAMQFEITNDAATEFSRGLYEAIAAGDFLDVAVAEGRKRVRIADSMEWLIPALFLQDEPRRLMQTPEERRQQTRENATAPQFPENDGSDNGPHRIHVRPDFVTHAPFPLETATAPEPPPPHRAAAPKPPPPPDTAASAGRPSPKAPWPEPVNRVIVIAVMFLCSIPVLMTLTSFGMAADFIRGGIDDSSTEDWGDLSAGFVGTIVLWCIAPLVYPILKSNRFRFGEQHKLRRFITIALGLVGLALTVFTAFAVYWTADMAFGAIDEVHLDTWSEVGYLWAWVATYWMLHLAGWGSARRADLI